MAFKLTIVEFNGQFTLTDEAGPGPRLRRLELVGQRGYAIGTRDGHPFINCLGCGSTSFHPTDIAAKYCGRCHVFHEEPAV
jgi:hypothetical protein